MEDQGLVVMTFNVLARKSLLQLLNRMFDQERVLSSLLKVRSKAKAPKVIQEILSHDPDIACLQEVDFLEEFGSPLKDHGYDWELKKKSINGHGLAVIYKTSRLVMKDYKAINYDEIKNFNSCFETLETGNMAQIIHFEILNTNTSIIITNTHLYWRPDASAIKIKQAWTLVESLYDFKSKHDATVLLCGDWNIMPQDILYRLLTRKESVSKYELEHVFEKNIDHGSQDHPAACEKILEFYPKVPKLKSTFNEFYGQEPPYTTISKDFSGVLDYIFIWGSDVEILNVKEINQVGEMPPNSHFPSDHVPIVAKFSVLKSEIKSK